MDKEYDVVVLGTGISECILSGLMSVMGRKVLHTDNNAYYGGESASLNLKEMFRKFKGTDPPEHLGSYRDYSIDLIMKLIIADGNMVSKLLYSKVTNYLLFHQIEGSYVYRAQKIYKVPTTQSEVILSPLLGLFQKNSLRSFLVNMSKCDLNKNQLPPGLTPSSTMMEVFKKYGLSAENQELIGHVLALQKNDDYLHQPALPTLKQMRLYESSLAAHGKSPYIYPLYGLADVPQSFARLCAVYGGTFMLSKQFTDVVYGEDGKVSGVRYGDEVAKTKIVIGDPSYFPDKVKTVNRVVRCICILDHPVKSVTPSAQIIIPATQTGRKSDIYASVISSDFNVAPSGKYIAIVSTEVESEDPAIDVKLGVQLMEPILEKFLIVSDVRVPLDDGTSTNVFISRSLDATTHFESTMADVDDLWKRITGEAFNIEDFKQKIVTESSP